MSEDNRTLWVGNLNEKVTEQILYELFLQTGPIDRIILPTEGDSQNKKHKGHAYIVFKHSDSVQYASQVLEGSCLFTYPLTIKARSLPGSYKSSSPTTNNSVTNKERFDNSSLRTGFNKATSWHGQNDLNPRGRGDNYRNRGFSNYNQNFGYNTGYYSQNNQSSH